MKLKLVRTRISTFLIENRQFFSSQFKTKFSDVKIFTAGKFNFSQSIEHSQVFHFFFAHFSSPRRVIVIRAIQFKLFRLANQANPLDKACIEHRKLVFKRKLEGSEKFEVIIIASFEFACERKLIKRWFGVDIRLVFMKKKTFSKISGEKILKTTSWNLMLHSANVQHDFILSW